VKNPVLSYKEFTDQKKLTESKNNIGNPLNESFLDAVLRFFRGIFDLFSNKKLKKNYEDMRVYYKRLQYNKDIDNDELADELNAKKIRKSFFDATKTITNGVEIDKEKGIRVTVDLQKHLASWVAQIIALNESHYLGIIQKMLSNKETIKKFTWVPKKYRENSKEWYKQNECVLDKKVKDSLLKVLTAPQEKQENLIKDFCKRYVEYVALQHDDMPGYDPGDGVKLLKANNKDLLDDIHEGFYVMILNVKDTMNTIVKNSQDDKIIEQAETQIRKDREIQDKKEKKKPASKDPNKTNPEEDDVKDATQPGRSRRSPKKIKKDNKPENSINTGTPPSTKSANQADKPTGNPGSNDTNSSQSEN
jgi:hypothetical protein